MYDIFWRWSQLLVAIVLVIVEWICRGAITLIFRIVPVPWKEDNIDASKHCEDPNCERGTIEYANDKGYAAEEHFVTTTDGYILALHRIPVSKLNGADNTGNDGDGNGNGDDGDSEYNKHSQIRPVLAIHGFMHSSEAFTIRQRALDSLPLVLNDGGYDVWLGNNRGNKYSHKHVSKKPQDDDFWDFSLDDMARYDLPTMIDYVLDQTGAPSLTLIGFSQGTAQAFAYLSKTSHSAKVNLFIALAPVIVPRGFANPVVDSLARSRPDFIFLLFGKRQLLPSTMFWRNNLPRDAFVYLIDLALRFLFDWDTKCLAEYEKPLLYSHIYAHASVKTVVQWFQIIQTKKFVMFDDYMSANVSSSGSDLYPGYVLPSYQLGQIKTPVACFCGGKDTLPHTSDILSALPKSKIVYTHIEEQYEHLDFMWAKDAAEKIYPRILSLLATYNNPDDCCEL